MKSRLFLFTACALAACLLQSAPLDVSGFSKSLTITVPAASVAQDVSLTNFPVLVRLSTAINGFRYSDFQQANGADLAFADSDGNALPYEIDEWNTSGESLVWVKLPVFARGTTFTAYYGSATVQANTAADVWSSYSAVWHCKEASGALSDSTGNGNSATPTGDAGYTANMVATDNGAVGTSRRAQDSATYFSGTKASHFVAESASFPSGSQFIFSGWFKALDVVACPRFVSTKNSYVDELGWEVEATDDARNLNVRGAGSLSVSVPCPDFSRGGYIHLVCAFDGATATCYTNGFLAASGNINAPSSSDLGLAIGNNANLTEAGWVGWFDEVRYRAGTVSAAEAEAEYRMVVEPNFLEYAKPAKVDPALFTKALAFTLNSGYANATVADTPVLVRLSTEIPGFSYSDFHDSNGKDLCFADASGVILPHEVDEWSVTGESLVWVRFPSGRAGTKIVAYYGSETYRHTNSTAVWEGYAGVWHMGEASGTANDATGYGHSGTPSGPRAEYNVGISDGAVGMARKNGGDATFAGQAYLSIANSDSWALGDTFTASGFFRVTGDSGWYRFFSNKAAGMTDGWGQECHSDNARIIDVYGSAGERVSYTIPTAIVGNWVHLSFVYSGTTCSMYANGEFVGSGTIIPALDNGLTVSIGGVSDGNEWCLYGDYDEVRIRRTALSASEIAFDYNAMKQHDFLVAESAGAIDTTSAAIDKISDASENGLAHGIFRVFRGAGSPADSTCLVDYVLSGTAVAGADYEGASSGTVVLSPGINSMDFAIAPLHNAASSEDKTVTMTLSGGAFATMVIENLSPPNRKDFRRRIDFTVSAPFLGNETLTNFPVLVRLSTAIEGFSYADFKREKGADITFFDSDMQTPIPHAVDEWNTSGESLVWVMVPELSGGKTFSMFYGSTADLAGASCVPWEGYVGVWHMNEAVASLPAHDATGNGLDAVPMASDGNVSPSGDYAQGGVVGRARWNQNDSTGNIGQHWYCVADTPILNVGREFIFSGWFKAAAVEYWPRIVSRKDPWNGDYGWEVELDSTTMLYARASANSTIGAETPDITLGWVHLAFAFTRDPVERVAVISVYVNGEPKASNKVSLLRNFDRGLAFGNNPVGGQNSHIGAFDELRYRGGMTSDNWIKAEYETVMNASFVSASEVITVVPGLTIIVR